MDNQGDDRIFTRSVDLLDATQVRSAAEAVAGKFGRIDILLHLVGGWIGGKAILDPRLNELTTMVNQHIWTSFHVIQAFVPHLVRNGWGGVYGHFTIRKATDGKNRSFFNRKIRAGGAAADACAGTSGLGCDSEPSPGDDDRCSAARRNGSVDGRIPPGPALMNWLEPSCICFPMRRRRSTGR